MPSLYFADLPNAARLGKVLGGELGGVGGRGAAHLLHHLLLLHKHLLDLLHLLVQLIQVHLQWNQNEPPLSTDFDLKKFYKY